MTTVVDIESDPGAVERYRRDWQALFASSPGEPSTSYEWVRAMCDTHLRRDDAFHLAVLRRDGCVCGLVPLVLSYESVAGVRVGTLVPLMERSRTHSDLLLDRRDAPTVAALAARLRALPGWDLFRLAQVLDSNPLLDALDTAFRATGATVLRRPEPPSFYLPLPATFEAYLADRSGKFRNHLRRTEKKLAATGALAVVTAGVDIAFDEAFDALLAIEARSWKHAHGTAISAIPHQAAFYGRMARGMLDAGVLHLTLLTRAGEPIAYNLGVTCHGEYAYLKTSYVEACKALGPAVVLRARLIESLIAAGFRAMDFPAEPYEWEAQWASHHRPHHSLTVYNRTLRARALAWVRRWRDARRPAAAGDIAYANARDLRPPVEGA